MSDQAYLLGPSDDISDLGSNLVGISHCQEVLGFCFFWRFQSGVIPFFGCQLSFHLEWLRVALMLEVCLLLNASF